MTGSAASPESTTPAREYGFQARGLTPASRNDSVLKPGYIGSMSNFMSHVAVPIAVGAVALVLLLGLVNMMRGGSPWTSQKLMRLRVMLQFIAIVVIMFAVWVMSK
jgi:hypothetical protein